jgi:hypothetical protein
VTPALRIVPCRADNLIPDGHRDRIQKT